MNKFSCIVVDDESFNIRLISDHISKCGQLHLLQSFSNPLEARDFLDRANDVDILFTDVDMPQLDGISFAENIQHRVGHIVFITSHFKRDLKPYLDKPWYYLAKPVSLDRFIQLMKEFPDQEPLMDL